MRALISVYNKDGIVDFAKKLQELGVMIFSTGGTKKVLGEAGIDVHSVSDLTSFPEILNGRVKTLHPRIHAGILAKRNKQEHLRELEKHGIEFIDIVVCNLYPFEQTTKQEQVKMDTALEMIDIGGPSMIRAAAKNFIDVVVVVNPFRYSEVLQELTEKGEISLSLRQALAAEAFQHTAYYDTVIAQYFRRGDQGSLFPKEFTIGLQKVQDLRYGENPHQKAAFYQEGKAVGMTKANQIQGKELSFNNILDADAALNLVLDFTEPTISIIKHVNPCGLASRPTLAEAFTAALSSDSLSAYGGIIGANQTIDESVAREIIKSFFEVIIAPAYTKEALAVFQTKEKLRVLDLSQWQEERKHLETLKFPSGFDYRRVRGGLLVQTRDLVRDNAQAFEVVSKRQPTTEEMEDMLWAWQVVGRVKSNAIVLVKNKALVGIGAGQMSRVVSVEIATKKAQAQAHGAVMASDAFFPFADGIEKAAAAGVRSVIQPCGSIRDEEVIKTVDSLGLAMVKTTIRHFLH